MTDDDPDAFAEDLCRLLREGLVMVDQPDEHAPPRFEVTKRGKAWLAVERPPRKFTGAEIGEMIGWNSGATR